jgi:chromosome partitioning protein
MSIPVIVVCAHKGGVGKTKHAIITAENFSYVRNKKGLGIDLDSQGNFAMRFLKMDLEAGLKDGKRPPPHPAYKETDPEHQQRNSIANIYMGLGVDPYPTAIENFEVLPGYASKFLKIKAVSMQEQINKVQERLKIFINLPQIQNAYDYIVIDTPPSTEALTISAFRAATHLLIPSEMEPYSISGIYGMLQLWKQENEIRANNDKLEIIGIFPNKVNRTKLHKDILASLEENKGVGKYIAPCYLGDRIIFAETDADTANPRTIFDLPDNNKAKIDATRVANFIFKKVFGND